MCCRSRLDDPLQVPLAPMSSELSMANFKKQLSIEQELMALETDPLYLQQH